MHVKSLNIIKQGTLTFDAFEEPDLSLIGLKKLAGVGGGSTVTYIESDKKILVDTGFDFEENLSKDNIKQNNIKLTQSLDHFGLKADGIDIVFITHWHLDHFGNIDLFKNSEILTSNTAEPHMDAVGIPDGQYIADGVKVIHTPGHTKDHASLLLKTENLQYSLSMGSGGRIYRTGELNIVVAGDAVVSPFYYYSNRIYAYNQDFFNKEAGLESVEKIKNAADYIISGHGGIFRNSTR
ncbi:MBL fold metallo-hydrolase [uncultured Methanobacterium sp.]|uniref:MBL fold metallo-hydrolase n=1 Tax=uncultured Methanobacterium sp. TaxID=176306 RepID=UPI002AA73170|nr:MBL fold metallo-hydrolase [uncultured Methanobacterium sp.]